MDRGTLQAIIHRVARVEHDWVTFTGKLGNYSVLLVEEMAPAFVVFTMQLWKIDINKYSIIIID